MNVFVIIVAILVTFTGAEICDKKNENGKQCPDFGEPGQFCCPSKVERGGYYCCSAEEKEKLRQEKLEAERKEFLRKNLPLILGITLGGLAVILLIVLLMCYNIKSCPLHRWKRDSKRRLSCEESLSRPVSVPQPSSSRSHYHPVRTTAELKPSLYEAPPPYTSAPAYPTRPLEPYWDYNIENRMNLERQNLRTSSSAVPKS